MNTSFLPANILLDQVPGEQYLLPLLQNQLAFTVNNKTIKKGKLLLFRRVHYFIQIALMTDKLTRENFDIPIPFKVENYAEEGLLYFDYRTDSLGVKVLPKIPSKISSTYFNKILEISIAS
jgi:hypothetical protein